ncbi:MAG TPA: orotidine-5'-phosphate decarboxylase [Thermodesulfobacteriota bacterium]|nr:orotidine-5'-phosphate decarboxylase [Thermodesulfobacteriota bacterium]
MEATTEKAKKKLIVALDIDNLSQARDLVKELKDSVGLFKIGHQLFTRSGLLAVAMVHEEGGKVFLDLKYHDIPHTVKNAVEAAVNLKVAMLNVHTLGGRAMMKAAAEAVRSKTREIIVTPPILLGVTVLTSLSDADLADVGIHSPVAEEVMQLATLAYSSGLNGVVASPQEISPIRKVCPAGFLIVTPGVRLPDAAGDDQKRVLTPRQAIEAGADYVVIGRPILNASDPKTAAQKITADMAGTFV